ncbi:SDR family oxidoreductase [Mycolicibacterium rhodesiae]|uniref:SDR family oxidoreductase n=1 Tax=Mycolicibacterium rhodesiae TaxID=36814 RepID=UPI0026979148
MAGPMTGKNVVVTGASAGIGRAVCRIFAREGANLGLLARGHDGLAATAAEVENLGGRAVAVATDVSDYHQVDLAADAIETQLGPVDIWINVAFASVFAPFHQIEPDEFKHVTEVSYLGFVYGTMVALRRMRPRDAGTIVQVGSALGGRAIPLQSAYCGAKHAVNGFSESLRTELIHDHSGVHVTVVQMPAVNTPQFTWVLSRLPRHPQPVPPIYQPEVAARAVLFAAKHPARKQFWVGASTVATLLGQRVAPRLLDRYLAATGYKSQQTNEPAPRNAPNLWEPRDDELDADHGAHGSFDDRSHARSPQWWLREHMAPIVAVAGGAAVAAVAAQRR